MYLGKGKWQGILNHLYVETLGFSKYRFGTFRGFGEPSVTNHDNLVQWRGGLLAHPEKNVGDILEEEK